MWKRRRCFSHEPLTAEREASSESPAAIRSRDRSLRFEVTEAALAHIKISDGELNCFTTVLAERALAEAAKSTARSRGGEDPGPLAGVPFAVKNLFDIRRHPHSRGFHHSCQCAAARGGCGGRSPRSNQAGAVLVGALNMDEFAYGFTTENSHYGATRNPHDLDARGGGFVRRFGGGGRSGHGSADARLRHQRLHPRACVLLRHLRPETDLWPPLATRRISLRRAVSIMSVPSRARRRILLPSTTCCRAPTPKIPSAPTRPAEPCSAGSAPRRGGLRIAIAGGYFADQGTDAGQ